VLRLFTSDEMNADDDMGFSALPNYLGALEQKRMSNENCIAIVNNVQQCSYPVGMLNWLICRAHLKFDWQGLWDSDRDSEIWVHTGQWSMWSMAFYNQRIATIFFAIEGLLTCVKVLWSTKRQIITSCLYNNYPNTHDLNP
jgi:hypothetical protein